MKQIKIQHKRATTFMGAEGIALHKPGVCQAKHAKHNNNNNNNNSNNNNNLIFSIAQNTGKYDQMHIT